MLSRAAPRLCEHRQLPWTRQGNSGVKRQPSQMLVWILFFLQLNLVQQHGKSLQITWASLGREKTYWDARSSSSAMHFFLGCVYPASPVKGLFNGVRLHCALGFMCTFLPIYCPVLDNWDLLDLLEMRCVQAPAYPDKSELLYDLYDLIWLYQISWGDTTSLLSKDPSKLIKGLDVPRSCRNGPT